MSVSPNRPDFISFIALAWKNAQSMFDYRKLDDSIKKALESAKDTEMSDIISIFLVAGMLATIISVLSTIESIYISNFTANTIADITDQITPNINFEKILPIGLVQLIMNIPFAIVLALAYEYAIYSVIRILFRIETGNDAFRMQVLFASIIAVAGSISSAFSLFVPLPCLGIVALLCWLIVLVYLAIYVMAKAYCEIYKIQMIHSLIITILLTIPRAVAFILAANWLSILFGLRIA